MLKNDVSRKEILLKDAKEKLDSIQNKSSSLSSNRENEPEYEKQKELIKKLK